MKEITPETAESSAAPAPTAQVEKPVPAAPPAPATELPLEAEADKAPKAKASALVKEAQAYITDLFGKELPAKLTYHTLGHTEAVVKECRALVPAAQLSEEDTENLLLAAWFHDAGYIDVYDGHEFRSMERAGAWLAEHGLPKARIELIQELIKTTHRDSPPETELQKLLSDADMSNLARDDYRSRAELLRTEWELVLDKTYSTPEWTELQLNFMLAHKYLSEAGKERYKKALKKNIEDQRDHLKKKEKKDKKKTKEKSDTFAEPKRGIETMFRTMYSNHMKLSDMADKKASMMIQLNAVLMSVIITYLGAKMGKAGALGPMMSGNPVLAIPMSILLVTALGSVITAILSAQPDVTSFAWLKKSPEIATNRRVNLLFFGQFTKLNLDNFQGGMRELMRTKDMLYTNMVTDIYYLGEVLTRKYRLLRTSYTIFMVGLILTALSFGIALLYKM
ncbi:HD domain-containing protein [Microvirga sp. STS02]|uniref:Pycsar system effector family protein n=1 Tax=Hymenobacter negativus TaxID=2795026 RepID=UPI0018DC88B9|nr:MULTISPECIES: Pycsar system effector family protein [Bacteria]MBH8570018.1 HD domain-containing protein [Hymenobacter negativus]MBR7209758.1 HD domain-containing protein [Microvirga sp. STS02]